MYKLAVVFGGDPFRPKGLFNAVLNRAIYLKKYDIFEIDLFCLCSFDTRLTSLVRKVSHHYSERQSHIVIDGIKINLWWYPLSIVDNILSVKLHKTPFFYYRILKRFACRLQGYDIISAHSLDGGIIADWASKKFGTPFCVTWHGSDIHTNPWCSNSILKKTIEITEKANANFYVSNHLLNLSENIIHTNNKHLSYNGVSDIFIRFSEEKILLKKSEKCISPNNKVVSYVGGLVGIKNVLLLPSIFSSINEGYDGDIEFWIVGDGKYRNNIKEELKRYPKINVKFWGDVKTDDMPDIMNCTDVLILPSKNEGLPLVIVEATSCGTNVVSSNVGGCIEVIGDENVVDLDNNFVANISERVIEILSSRAPAVKLDEKFTWHNTIKGEIETMKKIIVPNKAN